MQSDYRTLYNDYDQAIRNLKDKDNMLNESYHRNGIIEEQLKFKDYEIVSLHQQVDNFIQQLQNYQLVMDDQVNSGAISKYEAVIEELTRKVIAIQDGIDNTKLTDEVSRLHLENSKLLKELNEFHKSNRILPKPSVCDFTQNFDSLQQDYNTLNEKYAMLKQECIVQQELFHFNNDCNVGELPKSTRRSIEAPLDIDVLSVMLSKLDLEKEELKNTLNAQEFALQIQRSELEQIKAQNFPNSAQIVHIIENLEIMLKSQSELLLKMVDTALAPPAKSDDSKLVEDLQYALVRKEFVELEQLDKIVTLQQQLYALRCNYDEQLNSLHHKLEESVVNNNDKDRKAVQYVLSLNDANALIATMNNEKIAIESKLNAAISHTTVLENTVNEYKRLAMFMQEDINSNMNAFQKKLESNALKYHDIINEKASKLKMLEQTVAAFKDSEKMIGVNYNWIPAFAGMTS